MTTQKSSPLPEHVARRLREGAYQGHYGGCPVCGASDGPFNLHRENWFICTEHRVRWCVGMNLFDHLEGEWEAWEIMDRFLSRFREIPASETLSLDEEADRDDR